ncbi:hypothetical protein DBP21_00325 [Streptomyces sp. CS147]|nr:hypothetical protein DBP21_00325 [Streptomyces sp. CS147]
MEPRHRYAGRPTPHRPHPRSVGGGGVHRTRRHPRLATSDYKTVRMDTGPLQAAEQSRADVMDRIRTHPRRKETLANLTAGRNAWQDLTGRRPPR